MAAACDVSGVDIQAKIQNELKATHVEIEDISGGCGQAFSAVIVSPLFANKNTLARNRMVNRTLKVEIAAIHAWTPKCYTPDEWNAVISESIAAGEVVTGTTA